MSNLITIAAIGIGGAAGSICRYLINVSPLANIFEKFPFPTLVVNVSGSFLLGLLVILLAERIATPEAVRMALIIGFLGAFTTFSTFEFEMYGLVKERYTVTALLYLLLSVTLGFAGLFAGIGVARKLV